MKNNKEPTQCLKKKAKEKKIKYRAKSKKTTTISIKHNSLGDPFRVVYLQIVKP